MIKTYFKIAWRNLMKNKIFSFINVFGLSAGLASCMLIALYIHHETTYDHYHKAVNDIYQVGTTFIKTGEKGDNRSNTPHPVAEAMKREFPEVIAATHLLGLFADDKTLVQYNENNSSEVKSFYETKGYLTDSSFFSIFDYQFIEGNPAVALSTPNSIVLEEEIAKKIFGAAPAVNKVLHINSSTNGSYDYKVTGVFKTASNPSHIDARFFMSIAGGDMEKYINQRPNDFASNNMFFTYLKLKPGADYQKLEKKFPAFVEKFARKDLQAMGFDKKQFLIPLKDLHLSTLVNDNVSPQGSRTYLYILASIALFTLLIACINFMNLSTARSSKRSAEVGIRKVLGAEKKYLVSQFLGESVFMSMLAFILGMGLMYLMLPYFNMASGRNISFSIGQNWMLVLLFLAMAIITGFIAGSYPAFYLSSFIPVKVLKGRISNSLAAVSLRKGLVVFQFVISVVLIIASVVIASQMDYMRNKDLGFAKDQQVVIPLRSTTAKKIMQPLKDVLKGNSQVISAGASLYYPGIFNPSDNLFYKDGQSMHEGKRTRSNWIDFDFLKTLDVKLLAGRLFSRDFPTDTSYKLVVNEKTIKEVGFESAEKAVGQNLNFDWQGKAYHFQIVGVVKDFNFESLREPVTPFGFQIGNDPAGFNYLVVHTKPNAVSSVLQTAQNEWRRLNPTEPFEYSFLDADFMKNYEAETRLSALVQYFTLIAIIISCLGLFGLATFSAEQRTKEIGIRKVLGASVTGVVTLLSKDFLKLVALAVVIASPLAWYVMNKWLQNFQYKTSIGFSVFAITTVVAMLIALITISFQAIRAALSNPVKSLRTE